MSMIQLFSSNLLDLGASQDKSAINNAVCTPSLANKRTVKYLKQAANIWRRYTTVICDTGG